MTAAEQASLESLRTTVEQGFREVRDLIEQRRREDLEERRALVARLAEVERVEAASSAAERAVTLFWSRVWKASAFVVATGASLAYLFVH